MRKLITGKPGKATHPPLTDATIGAWTAGVVMLVLGALGIEETQMAHGALLAISAGIIFFVPTALTGLLDWLALDKGTNGRNLGLVHLVAMDVAFALFVLTWFLQLDGYKEDRVTAGGLIAGLGAELALLAGGWLGGTLVFVYGIRVLDRPDLLPADAIRLDPQKAGSERQGSLPEGAPPQRPGE